MIMLDQTNYTKVLNYFLKKLGYGYNCRKCKRRGKITQIHCNLFSRDFVSWQCPKCKGRWNFELKNKAIRRLIKQ